MSRFTPASGVGAYFDTMVARLLLVALFMGASAAVAQTVPAPDSHNATNGPAGGVVYRLTPAEIEATLDAAAARNAHQLPPLASLPLSTGAVALNDGHPHGEAGMMVGTGGARAVWGSTYVPLGQNGSAAFSFSTGRYPGMPY